MGEGMQECETLVGHADAAYSARVSQYTGTCKFRFTDFEMGPGGRPAKVVNTSQVCNPDCKDMVPVPVPMNTASFHDKCARVSPLAVETLDVAISLVKDLDWARLMCGGRII